MAPAAQPQKQATPGRLPELDLLRFVAAASVVFYHYTCRPRIAGDIVPAAFEPLPAATRFGYLGVTLFFMISGFVILWSSEARSAGEFVVSRAARLFPSFWICLLLTTLALGLAGEPVPLRTLLANATMIPGALGAPYVDGVYWTLFVELKFYLLVFLVLLTRTMPRVEWWLTLWLAACLLSAIGLAPAWLGSLALSPYGPYFISGCCFYLLRSRGASARFFGLLVVSCLLGARYAVLQQPKFIQEITLASSVTVAAAVVVFHLVFAAVALRPGLLPASRWWYWLGGLTYPLYLLHNRIGKVILAWLTPVVSAWLALAVMLIVAFGLAALLAAVVERRLCGALQRWMLTVRWGIPGQVASSK